MRTGWVAILASCAVAFVTPPAIVACDDGPPANVGLEEPLQISGGQFIAGPLPGTPAPTAPDDDGGALAPVPTARAITQASIPVLPLQAGAAGQSISGLATDDTVAVGVALQGLGTGYWVVPVGATDPLYPGQITFGFTANFSVSDPPGRHAIEFVALDGAGAAGSQFDAPFCIESIVPDNGHACSPSTSPPAAVISLSWDTNFDLDLHVVLPDGTDVNPKKPVGGVVDGGGKPPASTPQIDRDSLGGCVPDGLRREDLVFQDPPAAGQYGIYVDPFAPCGQTSVRFHVTIYQVAGTCPACAQTPAYSQGGEFLAVQATGGASTGLFVDDYVFAQ